MTNIFQINTAANAAANVTLMETKTGRWHVKDAADRKGGIFNTYKAAIRFIRDEFGTNANITTIVATEIAA